MSKWLELLKSRKFWAAILSVIVIIANDVFNIHLSLETLLPIVMTIIGWIVGQGMVDAAKVKAEAFKKKLN